MTATTKRAQAEAAWMALTKDERAEVISTLRIARRQGKGYPAALALIRAAENAAAEPEAPTKCVVCGYPLYGDGATHCGPHGTVCGKPEAPTKGDQEVCTCSYFDSEEMTRHAALCPLAGAW